MKKKRAKNKPPEQKKKKKADDGKAINRPFPNRLGTSWYQDQDPLNTPQ